MKGLVGILEPYDATAIVFSHLRFLSFFRKLTLGKSKHMSIMHESDAIILIIPI